MTQKEENSPNIKVEIKDGEVQLFFNSCRLFNTLANRETIVVGINEKLIELNQKFLEEKAKEEEKDREGR